MARTAMGQMRLKASIGDSSLGTSESLEGSSSGEESVVWWVFKFSASIASTTPGASINSFCSILLWNGFTIEICAGNRTGNRVIRGGNGMLYALFLFLPLTATPQPQNSS